MPEAIKYGMTTYEFWHEEKYLFQVYQRAYYSKLHENAWLNGLYINIAINNTLANAMRKKGEKAYEYPKEPFNPFAKNEKPLTDDQKEEKYRKLMIAQFNWLKRLKENKK